MSEELWFAEDPYHGAWCKGKVIPASIQCIHSGMRTRGFSNEATLSVEGPTCYLSCHLLLPCLLKQQKEKLTPTFCSLQLKARREAETIGSRFVWRLVMFSASALEFISDHMKFSFHNPRVALTRGYDLDYVTFQKLQVLRLRGLVTEECYHLASLLKRRFWRLAVSLRFFTLLGFLWKALVPLK